MKKQLLVGLVLTALGCVSLDIQPASAKECVGFNGSETCTWREYRTHCKKWKGCSAQYRVCRSTRKVKTNVTTQTCGDWQNRF